MAQVNKAILWIIFVDPHFRSRPSLVGGDFRPRGFRRWAFRVDFFEVLGFTLLVLHRHGINLDSKVCTLMSVGAKVYV